MFSFPPIRLLLPVLLLLFGLAMAWFDYRLNLANDLERNFTDVGAQVQATGRRLAAFCTRLLESGDAGTLQDGVGAWQDEPGLSIAAVVDLQGRVLADSSGRWIGRPAAATPANLAWLLVQSGKDSTVELNLWKGDDLTMAGAFPIGTPSLPSAWVLVVFDRLDAVSEARTDALRQLGWLGSATALLCFVMWALLHFSVAARLAWLARAAKRFGSGHTEVIQTLPGRDEIHDLSAAFASMSRQLRERERERAELEKEIIDSSELERRRIGHELHDGVGQRLTAVLMGTHALAEELQNGSPAAASKMENLSGQLRGAISEVRTLSHGLAPVPPWEGGLEHALQSLAESTTQNAALRCVFECEEPVEVADQEAAGNLYRIAQEAVNNALKHASASEIRIGLAYDRGALTLEIEDDGEGLSETASQREGIGLRVMRHRAESLGGSFSIGPAPAGGTRVAVHLDLRPSSSSHR